MENSTENVSLEQKMKSAVEDFELLLTEYANTWQDLNKYRGMRFVDDLGNPINEKEYEETNQTLGTLQALFQEMYPMLRFIMLRSSFAANMVKEYNDLMEKLVEGGAHVYKAEDFN